MDEFGPNTDRVYAFLDELNRLPGEDAQQMAAFWHPDETRRRLAWRHVERLRKGEMRDAWQRARSEVVAWASALSVIRPYKGPAPFIQPHGVMSADLAQGEAFPAAIDAMTAFVFERALLPFEQSALLAPWHVVRPGPLRPR